MQYKRGQFVGNHGLSYTITNLTMVAIWRSNGFRIHPLIAEKKTTLLFQGTFGHTVPYMDQKVVLTQKICQIQLQEVEITKRDIVCIIGIFNIL